MTVCSSWTFSPAACRRGLAFILFCFVLTGCATTESTNNGESSTPARSSGLRLAPQVDRAKTVQLFRGTNEAAPPILRLNGSQTLTLAFDLLGESDGPVSVYFYHANREWERDPSSSRFLASFQSDNVLDYSPSQGTEVRYTHYRYSFPNDDIQFEASGNYIVRVTEQGREDAVLFERPFFITEDAGSLNLGVEGIIVTGQQVPSDRPIAQYVPPAALGSSTYDYAVCFVRNADYSTSRCADRSRLMPSDGVEFELSRDRAFDPIRSRHALDLSQLRVGPRIERVDRSVSPFQVMLEPDVARFAGTPFRDPLGSQIVVSDAVTALSRPETAAEYVQATFAFVPPDEQPVSGDVVIAGGFTGGQVRPENAMRWVMNRGRYEVDVLLKQGRYEYFYASDDPQLEAAMNRNITPAPDRYVAFVYYRDITLSSDRLVNVGTVEGVR
ncbi:type IX secretion system plug protein domain-containing protein [Longibacter salinarum]|nr:type IX secretion system plug protein domain-containing protein [Longibacter salinarum]